MMGMRIDVDGTCRHVEPEAGAGKPYELKELQGHVGGYVELVPHTAQNRRFHGVVMLADEEGRLKNLPLNPAATIMAGRVIFGTVLLLSSKEFDPEPDEVLEGAGP